MDLSIPYGKDEQLAQLDSSQVEDILTPNKVDLPDSTEEIQRSLANPIDTEDFDRFIQDAESLLFIVNDATRPTPTSKILSLIEEKIADKEVKFVVATGSHRYPTENEFEFIFGDFYQKYKDHIHVHETETSDFTYFGTSKRGTEVKVNSLIETVDKVIAINSVEPHYFAGFTGGRKSILPGISAYKTIEHNHEFSLKEEARTLNLKGNPVHEDMEECADLAINKPLFSVQVVLDKDQNIYSIISGDIHKAFYKATQKAKEVFCVEVDREVDIVVTVAPFPMDINLYQSQKAIENAKLALKDDGILILVSKCRDGIGPPTFYDLMKEYDTPEEVLKKIKDGYVLGYHKAAKLAQTSQRAEIWAITDLEEGIVTDVFMKPFSNFQSALESAFDKKGDQAKVLVLKDGGLTVPLSKNR